MQSGVSTKHKLPPGAAAVSFVRVCSLNQRIIAQITLMSVPFHYCRCAVRIYNSSREMGVTDALVCWL